MVLYKLSLLLSVQSDQCLFQFKSLLITRKGKRLHHCYCVLVPDLRVHNAVIFTLKLLPSTKHCATYLLCE